MSRRESSVRGLRFHQLPFDREYRPIFEAIVFCVVDCGFVPRSALQITESGEVRVPKLRDLIRARKYAIHGLPRVELSSAGGPPRFFIDYVQLIEEWIPGTPE